MERQDRNKKPEDFLKDEQNDKNRFSKFFHKFDFQHRGRELPHLIFIAKKVKKAKNIKRQTLGIEKSNCLPTCTQFNIGY